MMADRYMSGKRNGGGVVVGRRGWGRGGVGKGGKPSEDNGEAGWEWG